VYDYATGKADWLAAGLPTVRGQPPERRALEQADRDPPTCAPDTPVGRLELDSGSRLVVDEHGVVLGRVRPGDHPPTATAEDVMEPGPATVRASEPLDPLLDRMRERSVPEMVVTTPEGRLLGVIRR
jgi:CBS domain-containing protein